MEKTELDPSQTCTVKGQEAMYKQYHRGETDEVTLKSSSVRVMYRSKLPRDMVQSPSLDIFRTLKDEAQNNII